MGFDIAAEVIAREQEAARAELERRAANERGRYFSPNGRADQFISLLDMARSRPKGSISIFILRAGNSFGKTALAVNLINYLGDRINNKHLDRIKYLREFKRPNHGRLCTTANAAKNTYAQEIPKWFSRNQYDAKKVGREFDSHYTFKRTGSTFDVFTFDQDPESGESITLDWAIIDEPMSHRHWSALKSRIRFGGFIVFILTPLEGSGWYHDLFETPERLGKDVWVLEGSSEDNCKQHGVRGIIPHEALEDMWRDFDETELPARRDGKYLHLSGVIYGTYRDDETGHVLPSLPPYYQDCFDRKLYTLYQVVDPHDRKPFAIGWHAAFPNDHVFTIAEWPDSSMQPFHRIRQWNWDTLRYAQMIVATEQLLGKPADIRLIDPNFGLAPKAGGDSVLKQFIAAGLKNWKLPPDSVSGGHVRVKYWLGDPQKNVTPMWNILAHCKNHRYGMSHYGYKENRDESRGLSETPELQHKDFPDLIRYAANYGIRYIKYETSDPSYYQQPTKMGNGYVGI